MKEVKLNIEGMHCTGCSTRLEKDSWNFEIPKCKRSLPTDRTYVGRCRQAR